MLLPYKLNQAARKRLRTSARKSKLKILTYDMETTPNLADIWRPGKQLVLHGQLMGGYFDLTHVICITYAWAHENKSHCLTWGESGEDELEMLKTFDEILKEADIVIGKNNKRFDDKHKNAQNFFYNLSGDFDWLERSDDLEQQLRKYFNMTSYSLDFISEKLGLGGKIKMQRSDWQAIYKYRYIQLISNDIAITKEVTIVLDWTCKFWFGKGLTQVIKEGKAALKQMFEYGKKDADDTLDLTLYTLKFCKFKKSSQIIMPVDSDKISHIRCTNPICGSRNFKKNGARRNKAGVIVQNFECKDCLRHFQANVLKNGGYGKVR